MLQPDYTRTQQLLAHEHSLADAAEAHGTLAGCLCGASGYRFEDWLKEILPEGRATAALAQWCQGFLYGLGAGRITDASELPGEVGEIVRDFIAITRADADAAEEADEADENAYAELVEFVRVGVQLLFEELAVARAPAAPSAA